MFPQWDLHVVQDVVRTGQTISSTKFERRAGGKGANQAVAVARAGGDVSLVGAVGEDGTWLVRNLEGCGVSTTGISVVQVCLIFPRLV
jgi:ribokinase